MSLLLASAGIFNTLPVVGGGGGGLSIVAVSGGHEVPSGASTTDLTIPGTPLQDDCVVVLRSCDTTLSGTGISGYSDISVDTGAEANGWSFQEKRMGATPDTVVTVPQLSRYQSAVIAVIRGVHATFLDVAMPTPPNGNTSTIGPPAITTSTNGALLMVAAILDDDDSDVTSFPSGYTNTAMSKTSVGDGANGASIGVAFKALPTAGLETPGNFVFASTDSAYAFSMAIQPA